MRGEFSDLSFGARSLPKRLLRAAYLRWFYAQVDRFCFIGEGARRHLVRNGVTDSQLFFSPYSVDDALIATQKRELSRARARSELGIDDRRFVFVLSGKLIPRKDPLAIVRAIERLPDREHVGLISLGDGELNDDFSAHARALLGDRFIAPGFVNQSQLGRYFIAADAMVMTSRFETWGLVVNEAMHYGIPVIANAQVGSTANLVLHGQTGLLYESENPASLADAMLELVRSPARARKLGAAAHELIANYTIEASAAGIFQALKLSAPGRPLARPASELLP
jgi:glycosyltransferase involved in cell wall biosynthesis